MPNIVAHRGAAGYVLENTLQAFEMALKLGCRHIECDVRRTKDNNLIVFHDPRLGRMTNGKGVIAKMTLAQLKKVQYSNGQSIPTLAQVIRRCKGKATLYIDLKVPGIARRVNELIWRNNMQKRVVILSFNYRVLREMRYVNPNIKICQLFHRYSLRVWRWARLLGADSIGAHAKLIRKPMVVKAHQLNMRVYAYGADTKPIGRRLMNIGVDDIATDYLKLFV